MLLVFHLEQHIPFLRKTFQLFQKRGIYESVFYSNNDEKIP